MDENLQDLPRHERRKILREQEKEKLQSGGVTKVLRKFGLWILVLGILVIGGYWLFKNVTKKLPGEAVADSGREHVTDIAGVTYTSNPPTSGSHFPVWAKPGVYDRLISDGYLIHSLEHGYIIISYDCEKPVSSIWPAPPRGEYLVSSVYAHDELAKESTDSGQFLMHMKVQPQGDMSWFTPQNPPEVEVELPEAFQTDSCKNLARQLSEFTKVAQRVIVVPRLNMDSPVVLTAWNRIEKLNTVDSDVIKEFIKAFHNKGPEQTAE
ncbi:hypothetical protein A2210_00345 [Candidatus Woesebacteria bacterium RIFOXYA1_FULL_40_18]|uniref:DUF3105 domain-containing protein n=1 Tax=Candidatus Woesebacteria bacterium RIFOXYA1_FULL_40_18 TaxID=1802532 RepID=A0A1F8CGN5_9BACT|nr:MAG: hypothetical protein A2210_00345 [Candidatus Woesebacteria bacterium RIFOXYA1_FULL_40_18]